MSKNKDIQPCTIFSNKDKEAFSLQEASLVEKSLLRPKIKDLKFEGKPRLLGCILLGGGLSIALSLRFCGSAHAASSVPPPYVNRFITSSKSNLLGSTENAGSTSIVNLNKNIPLEDNSLSLKKAQNINKERNLPLVLRSPFLGARFVEDLRIPQRSSNQKSVTARSSLPELVNVDIDLNKATKDFNKPNLTQKLTEYNITMDNSTSQIADPHIRGIVFISACELANCKLSHLDEVECLVKAMHKLRIHQIDTLGPNNDLNIIQQKNWGIQFLLREDLKTIDSYQNQLTQRVENVRYDVVNALTAWYLFDENSSEWSSSFGEKFNHSVQKLKKEKADDLAYLYDEYKNDPSCVLPLRVYKEVAEHYLNQYCRIRNRYNHYWKFRNHWKSTQDQNAFLKNKQKQKNPPSNFTEAAFLDADQIIKQESLIDHYNTKNKANYELDYKNQTGREPNLFGNWVNELCKPQSPENINSKTSKNEEGYLCPPSFSASLPAPKAEEEEK
nr:hypothetical protein [Klebsormidium nitens]